MSAQESTIATLQHQLHEENKRRFEQIERKQDKHEEILDKILANTVDLPKLKEIVEALLQSVNGRISFSRASGGTNTISVTEFVINRL